MARSTETTTKFKVDISELKASIQEANRQIALANSEFKKASAGMQSWSTDADGLSAKLRQLEGVTQSYETILGELKEQYAKVVQEQGENSEGATDLKIKINALEGSIKGNNAQMERYRASLSDIQKAQDDVGSAAQKSMNSYERLQNTISEQEKTLQSLKGEYSAVAMDQGKSSKEAKALASEIKSLSSSLSANRAEMANMDSATDALDNSLDNLGDAARDAGDGFTVMKGTMANLLASGIKAVGSAIARSISSIAGLSAETQEYREDMGKLKTAFDDAKVSTETATKTYKDFYSVLGEEDRSVEAVNHLAKFVSTEQDMVKWTDIAAGVWGTFGDSLPIEGLTEAANETAKVGEVTGPLADALNWAGVFEESFNKKLEKCNSERERASLITDTLNGLYKNAAGAYRENNASVIEARKAQSDYNDMMAEMGAKIEPVTTKVKKGFNKILRAALDMVSGVDFEQVGAAIEKGFDSFVNVAVPAIQKGFTFIIENKDTIIAGLKAVGAAVATAFVATKIVSFVTTITKVVKVVKNAGTVMGVLSKVIGLVGGPVGIAVAAITTLVGVLTYLWNTSDAFREFWIALWDTLKQKASDVVEWFKGIPEWFAQTWESVKEGFSAFGEAIGNFFTDIYETAKTFIEQNWKSLLLLLVNPVAGIFKLLYDHCEGFREFIDEWFGKIKVFFTEKIPEALTFMVKKFEEMKNNVKKKIDAVWTSIKTWASNMVNKALEVGSKFLSNIVNFFTQLPGKIGNFISSAFNKVKSWVVNMVNKAKEAGSKFLDNVVSFFSKLPGKISKTLTSVIKTINGWIRDGASKAKEFASTFISKVVSGFANIGNEMWKIGDSIISGIWNGISSGWNWLINKVSDLAGSLFNAAKNALDINSPSRVFRDGIGKMIPEGIAVGVKRAANSAQRAVRTMTNNLLPEAQNLMDDLEITPSVKLPKRAPKGTNGQSTGGNVYQTFNQYNTSPKSLSRLEIYRQTRNQLAFARGV